MKALQLVSTLAAILLLAGAASALSGPRMIVTYDLDVVNGGRLDYHITDTPLGLGDAAFVMTALDDVGGVGG